MPRIRPRVLALLLATVVVVLVAGGCVSRSGDEPQDGTPTGRSDPTDQSDPTDRSDPTGRIGPVDLRVPVELSPVIQVIPPGQTPTGEVPSGQEPAGETVPGADGSQYVLDPPFLILTELGGIDATPAQQSAGWVLVISMTDQDGAEFGLWTTNHVGEQLAIVVDGTVISAPSVQEPIPSGDIQVHGGADGFTQQEADDLIADITGR